MSQNICNNSFRDKGFNDSKNLCRRNTNPHWIN